MGRRPLQIEHRRPCHRSNDGTVLHRCRPEAAYSHDPVARRRSATTDAASTSQRRSSHTGIVRAFAVEVHDTHVAESTRQRWPPACSEDGQDEHSSS